MRRPSLFQKVFGYLILWVRFSGLSWGPHFFVYNPPTLLRPKWCVWSERRSGLVRPNPQSSVLSPQTIRLAVPFNVSRFAFRFSFRTIVLRNTYFIYYIYIIYKVNIMFESSIEDLTIYFWGLTKNETRNAKRQFEGQWCPLFLRKVRLQLSIVMLRCT